MAALPRSALFTYADLQQMPDDLNRYEIIEGVLQVTPAPSTAHQQFVLNLGSLLNTFVRARQLGSVFVAPFDVRLSDISVVEPDILFVARGPRATLTAALVEGPPDLVVEVLSPGTAQRDRGAKQKLYLQHEVLNYWLADPFDRTLAGLTLRQGAYRQVALARDAEPFSAPPFTDLVIPLGEMWD